MDDVAGVVIADDGQVAVGVAVTGVAAAVAIVEAEVVVTGVAEVITSSIITIVIATDLPYNSKSPNFCSPYRMQVTCIACTILFSFIKFFNSLTVYS